MTRAVPSTFGTALLLAAALTACSEPAPPPPPPSVAAPASPPPSTPVSTEATKAMALKGEFPPGPELNVFMARCAICHTTSYISQQRLTAAQWEKTVKKMKGWGAPITDDEVAPLVAYFATHFPVDLPPPAATLVPPPPDATSEATP